MKALSVRQPWAYAILRLGKSVENRTWPLRLRTPFECVIHAGKAWGRSERLDLEDLRQRYAIADELALGSLLGIVTVTGCVTAPRDERDGEWFCGPYAFTLENPRPFAEPIPWKGALGFFDVEIPAHAAPATAAEACSCRCVRCARLRGAPSPAHNGRCFCPMHGRELSLPPLAGDAR